MRLYSVKISEQLKFTLLYRHSSRSNKILIDLSDVTLYENYVTYINSYCTKISVISCRRSVTDVPVSCAVQISTDS